MGSLSDMYACSWMPRTSASLILHWDDCTPRLAESGP